MKIIHLSDFHIGCKKRYAVLKTHFDETINYLKNNIEQPEEHIIIVTGDITHNANEDDFGYAANSFNELRTLGFKVLAVPGNHDYRVKDEYSGGIEDSEQARKLFCESFYDGNTEFPKKNIFEFTNHTGHIEKIAFIGIDSDEDNLKGSKGKIGKRQRKELSKKLKLSEVQQCNFKVVYLHHNPFAHRLSFWGMKLKDRKDFIRIIKRHNISLLLYGHTHLKSFKINKKNIGLCIDGGTTTGRGKNKTPARIIDITTIDFENIDDFEKEDIESHFSYINEGWRE